MRLPVVPKEEVAVSETEIVCLAAVAGAPEAALALQCLAAAMVWAVPGLRIDASFDGFSSENLSPGLVLGSCTCT